ncbi:MAG: endonuclease/exonuclease/phosphatase family protein [Porcipelethomonas sp.]
MVNIRILTLNTHSLIEENYQTKLNEFVNAVSELSPDIIALQEVNQSAGSMEIQKEKLTGYIPCQFRIPVKEDNHVYNAVKMLSEKGIKYYWTYLPIKNGYDRFDEGLALMSIHPFEQTDIFRISKTNDYFNWKTRMALGIFSGGEWYYCVHTSWWNDKDEPFSEQWKRISAYLDHRDNVWLMGDFNNPAHIKNEGYDTVLSYGWYDTYELAETKDNGITVGTIIDGWKERISDTDGLRIDYIWKNSRCRIKSSTVIFNEKNFNKVSDHFGIIIDTV